MSAFLYKLGRACATHRWRTLGAWILLAVVLTSLGTALGGEKTDNFSIPGAESQTAIDLLTDRFPARSGASARVVFDAGGQTVRDLDVKATLEEVRQNLLDLSGVSAVTDLYGAEGVDHIAPGGHIAYLDVSYSTDFSELGLDAGHQLQAALEPARDAGLTAAVGGDIVTEEEEPSSEMIGIGVAVIVLLIAFGSLIAMGLPLVTAMVGLGVGMALITILSAIIDVNTIAPMIASMIGLAVGIDYALFVVARHRQQLAGGMGVIDSIALANATAGQAVVFAGGTVVIAICGLALAGIPFVAAMGYAAAVVVLGAVGIAVSLLPALLGFAGTKIDRFKVPGLKIRHEADPGAGSSLGARWSRMVVHRPWRFLAASVAILGVLTVPLFSLRLGQTDDGNAAPDSSRRIAYDLMGEGFGAGFNGPLTVVVDLDNARGGLAVAETVRAALADTPGIAQTVPAIPNPTGNTALVVAIPTTSPQSAETEDLLGEIRRDVLPPALEGTGAEAYVTGSTAMFIDMSEKVTSRLPIFILAVVALSFLLLMASFRSVLVPLKAALANVLGIGASYGVVVAVFQWGWGMNLIGLEETVPVVSFVPMMMFAIVFGLSMDYEVFILSRVREEWVRTGDTRESVVTGLASSARVITAAATIMISVFGSFILGSDPIIKMFGVGLSVAVLLDATVIRMMLVPAALTLMGKANWWLPAWLDRILPRIDVEGSHIAHQVGAAVQPDGSGDVKAA